VPTPNVLSGEPMVVEVQRRVRARNPRAPLADIDRYAREIGGHFDARVYRLAARVVPPALSALLHGFALSNPRLFDVEQTIQVSGEIEALRALARAGTVILAPTHVSNLDSLVMGSVIHRLGLPPFAYAAGLNLFSNRLIGFFMRQLGAYTVDRKKTDPVYLDTLKEYATLLLERGQHTLLFPGGTRSRSGALEQRLKLGLLGTAPAAFRGALAAGAARPRIYVVPCTLSYPLVLEAASLIADHRRAQDDDGDGGHDGPDDGPDEFDHVRRWITFFRGLRRIDAHLELRFSSPLDCLGHDVDPAGRSRDPGGREIDPADCLRAGGRLVEDEQRDAAYTRHLAARILDRYRRDNVARPTWLLAFVVFELAGRARPAAGASFAEPDVQRAIGRALADLARLESQGAIRLGTELGALDASHVVARALATFATYHRRPVIERRGDRIVVGDPALLLYYKNRLDGYGLDPLT
jgi:glycerol-3-phosphate O-acyltransferase